MIAHRSVNKKEGVKENLVSLPRQAQAGLGIRQRLLAGPP